ncbi:MAG: YkvA family protein [Actinomycetota bacterium]|nr:YkvA family protein [Actinomycetota bacterium]
MDEQSWKPRFRTARSTITKVLQSSAFRYSRERAPKIIDDAAALRRLAEVVETLDYANPPLSTVADRVAAAIRFLRHRAHRLETDPDALADPGAAAGHAARERLIVASLDYLITPVDLVPDFRPGGYIDDVLLLSWVFGAAADELEPYLEDEPQV